MTYKLDSNIWSTYLTGDTTTLTTRDYEALKIGEAQLYGSEELRVAVEAGTVTAEQQL